MESISDEMKFNDRNRKLRWKLKFQQRHSPPPPIMCGYGFFDLPVTDNPHVCRNFALVPEFFHPLLFFLRCRSAFIKPQFIFTLCTCNKFHAVCLGDYEFSSTKHCTSLILYVRTHVSRARKPPTAIREKFFENFISFLRSLVEKYPNTYSCFAKGTSKMTRIGFSTSYESDRHGV